MNQTDALSHTDTVSILTRFYDDCVRFWEKEKQCCAHHYEEPIDVTQMALRDIDRLNHNPYVPNGKPLDKTAQHEWLAQHGYKKPITNHKGGTE